MKYSNTFPPYIRRHQDGNWKLSLFALSPIVVCSSTREDPSPFPGKLPDRGNCVRPELLRHSALLCRRFSTHFPSSRSLSRSRKLKWDKMGFCFVASRFHMHPTFVILRGTQQSRTQTMLSLYLVLLRRTLVYGCGTPRNTRSKHTTLPHYRTPTLSAPVRAPTHHQKTREQTRRLCHTTGGNTPHSVRPNGVWLIFWGAFFCCCYCCPLTTSKHTHTRTPASLFSNCISAPWAWCCAAMLCAFCFYFCPFFYVTSAPIVYFSSFTDYGNTSDTGIPCASAVGYTPPSNPTHITNGRFFSAFITISNAFRLCKRGIDHM